MVLPEVFCRLSEWVDYQLLGNSFYKAAKKMRSYGFHIIKNPSQKSPPQPQPQQQQQLQFTTPSLLYPNLLNNENNLLERDFKTMVFDEMNGTLLRSQSFFPYFMLVAFEGGSIIRAFLLLLSYPLLWVLGPKLRLRVMTFITFCGLKFKDMGCVEKTVLPKFYLEDLNFHVFQVLVRARSKVVFTSVPRVMVEGFLKEFLKVDNVVGTELHSFGNYFTGLLSGPGLLVKHKALKDYFGDERPDVGIGNSALLDHLFFSTCKEAYVVNPQEEEDGDKNSSKMQRDKYPKPLIFHDGRLAFLPTPLATVYMFMWLPLGLLLAIFRLLVGIYLPYHLSILLGTLSGIRLRSKGIITTTNNHPKPYLFRATNHIGRVRGRGHGQGHKGVLYVCTHRTLLDPVILGVFLGKPLTAVTYSLSKTSEIMAPLRTVRLTRDRNKDGETMQRLLGEGDLVVCPEGTTCREPYLLRFSSLFAELTDEIVPVALDTEVTLFYGTTASGLKWLDPIFFLMNPRPCYYVHVLEKVPKEETCGGGGRSSFDVANHVQRQLARALGFECTVLTRKDKYLLLAGNEGRVGP